MSKLDQDIFKTISNYYQFIKNKGKIIRVNNENNPSSTKPGYYIKELDFFISKEKLYSRINHLKNLRILSISETLNLRSCHIRWLLFMQKFCNKQLVKYVQSSLSTRSMIQKL